MTLMDSKVGNSKIMVDDSKPVAGNIVYTSAKAVRKVCIGQCSLTAPVSVKTPMTLVPVADTDQLVKNNTFKCPVAGWWMIWLNFGPSANTQTFSNTNGQVSAWYKVNTGTEVKILTFANIVGTTQVPASLQVGDIVSLLAANTVASTYKGTYCFEFIQ